MALTSLIFQKSAGGVVYRMEDGQPTYLLLKNINRRRHPPSVWWEFPKGAVEKGEDVLDALKREVEEETALRELELKGHLGSIKYYFKRANGTLVSKAVTYHLVKALGGQVQISDEHEDFAWLSYEDAISRLKFKNHKKVLKRAKRLVQSMAIDVEVPKERPKGV
ncbi:MAG: bis(5'-nucleosyl)-tetraphosphatase [Candidatus Geothermarchaeales archaeon]